MFAQATLKLAGPMDHLRLVWQTGETLLGGVSFDADAEGTAKTAARAVVRSGYRNEIQTWLTWASGG